MRLPRQIRYRGSTYVLAEVPPDFDMDRIMDIVKSMLRDSTYAKERFDHSSTQRFDDDLDVAATILANAIFHDLIFSEPRGNYAKYFSWLVQHYPKASTPAPVYDVVRGLREVEPAVFQRIVRAVRPEAV